jgi:hypothetical protein
MAKGKIPSQLLQLAQKMAAGKKKTTPFGRQESKAAEAAESPAVQRAEGKKGEKQESMYKR